MTEQDPPAGTPDLPPRDGSRSPERARAGHDSGRQYRTGVPAYQRRRADVIVVGAGPAGSAVAYYLATAGLDVLVLEKSQLPAREGLRRRADPARGQGADQHGRADRRRATAGCATRACGSSAAAAASSWTGPTCPATRATAWSAPGRTSTRSWPGTRRRPAPGCSRASTSPARCSTTAPAASSASRPRTRPAASSSAFRPAGRRRRRQLLPAVGGDGPAQARRPADGRGRPHLLHLAPARRRLPRGLAGPVGRQTRCCPATAGSSGWATAPPTSASAC